MDELLDSKMARLLRGNSAVEIVPELGEAWNVFVGDLRAANDAGKQSHTAVQEVIAAKLTRFVDQIGLVFLLVFVSVYVDVFMLVLVLVLVRMLVRVRVLLLVLPVE
jgi:hypothetical protein